MDSVWSTFSELWTFIATNFEPSRDIIDLTLVALAIYWLLLLIRGTRAVQILEGWGR